MTCSAKLPFFCEDHQQLKKYLPQATSERTLGAKKQRDTQGGCLLIRTILLELLALAVSQGKHRTGDVTPTISPCLALRENNQEGRNSLHGVKRPSRKYRSGPRAVPFQPQTLLRSSFPNTPSLPGGPAARGPQAHINSPRQATRLGLSYSKRKPSSLRSHSPPEVPDRPRPSRNRCFRARTLPGGRSLRDGLRQRRGGRAPAKGHVTEGDT